MSVVQIPASAAASILGIKTAQVRTLINRGMLRHLNPGAHSRNVMVDHGQVLKLKEKCPTPNDLQLGRKMNGTAGRARMTGATNAAVLARLDTVIARLDAIEHALISQGFALTPAPKVGDHV